ncbi:BRAP2 RING ZnF UBP domain-containing protein 2 isoform X1 [Punica granatum]|uniref:BRAP2 RING ZnF UBP domain-containing protein 2 isoform X1 n=1 Tax=Punica granatum TaxID=22663 RepID=A0A6P8CNM5_PUNGR|nr:BRAP2 RING ZnF UBP domain-containing protein 2 isoform X1 [Punica granatum]
MSSASWSGHVGAGPSPEEKFHPPALTISGVDLSSPSSSSVPGSSITQAFHFSSGNPRIEETRGVMHLFPEDGVSCSSANPLPVGRNPLLCVLGVPNHMTYSDFCQFCAAFIQHIVEMRIVRNDGTEDRYSVLIRFDSQDSADSFFKYFNGRRFNSLEVCFSPGALLFFLSGIIWETFSLVALEYCFLLSSCLIFFFTFSFCICIIQVEICRILYTVDVQYFGYKGSTEHMQAAPMASSEQPACPVCLERLDHDPGGTLTTICNHTFHISCISNWTDSSCPVCRFCQQQPEKSICFVCQTSENLWICVICGFVGCGRYKSGHAIIHWQETQHCYSLELETQRVWDYVGDNYVQRLIQSKTDGKLVALNSNDGCGSFEDAGMSEALLNSQVEAIVNEYNQLLATQLENQKLYYESLLEEVKEETRREISEAVEKAINKKLHKQLAKLEKCMREKKILDELNENLLKNQEIWESKISELEEREGNSSRAKDEKIQELEKQLGDLMLQLEAGQSV